METKWSFSDPEKQDKKAGTVQRLKEEKEREYITL
jgi:hypothetical protein